MRNEQPRTIFDEKYKLRIDKTEKKVENLRASLGIHFFFVCLLDAAFDMESIVCFKSSFYHLDNDKIYFMIWLFTDMPIILICIIVIDSSRENIFSPFLRQICGFSEMLSCLCKITSISQLKILCTILDVKQAHSIISLWW